jgi:hypothetical protein
MPIWPFPPTPTIATPVIPSGLSALDARPTANDAWESLRQAAANQGANYETLNITYFGAGRFVPDPFDAAQTPVAGTGLTLRIQNDTYLIGGRIFVVNNGSPTYVVLSGILAGETGGIEVFAGIDEPTNTLVTKPAWQFDPFPSSPIDMATVAGLLHLGRATTDGSSVTGFTPSARDGFGIIRPRGYGVGVGGGDTDYWGAEAKSSGDPTTIDQALAALKTTLEAEIAAGGVIPSNPKLDMIMAHLAAIDVSLVEIHPVHGERIEALTVVPEIFGDNTFDSVNFVGDGDMVLTGGEVVP